MLWLLILLLPVAAVLFVWRNELLTLLTLKKIAPADEAHRDGCVYRQRCYGGYSFERFLSSGGCKNDDELRAFIIKSITHGIPVPMSLSAGCSSFTCETKDGHRLFCRNFDLSKSNTCLVYTKPGRGRYASFSTADMKYCGVEQSKTVIDAKDKVKLLALPYAPMDGMNEKGLAASIYVSCQGTRSNPEHKPVKTDMNTGKPGLNSSTLIRLVLDYCSDVEEAIELISHYDLHDSSRNAFHYSLSDAKGNAACLDWVGESNATDSDGSKRRLVITRSEGTKPLVITNHVLAKGYYGGEDEMCGLDRLRQLQGELDKTGGVVEDAREAMRVLSIVGRRGKSTEEGLQNITSMTLYSVVYDLTAKKALLCANEHYGEEKYTFEYSFDDIFAGIRSI